MRRLAAGVLVASPLEAEQVVHGLDAELDPHPAEQDHQQLGGRGGVAQGAVTAVDLDAEVLRQLGEPLRGQRRQHPPSQPEGVDGRVLERRQARLGERHVEEARVERQVVGHEHGVAQELQETRHHLRGGGLPVDHRRRDARQPGDPVGHVAAGVDELLEGVHDLAADQPRGADLDQAVVSRPRPGGLGVDDDEFSAVDVHGFGRSRQDAAARCPLVCHTGACLLGAARRRPHPRRGRALYRG